MKNGRLKILPFFMPNLYKYTHIVLTFENFKGSDLKCHGAPK